jgi:acyl carrier protein
MDGVTGDLKMLLARALRDTDRAPEVSDDDDIVNGLGLDSLQMIRFLLDVESHFGVELDFEHIDLATLGSVRRFAGVVAGLMGRGAEGA